MGKSAQQAFITVAAAIFLAVTYIGVGYAVCAGAPFVTEKAAFATVDADSSPFDRDQLVEGALATREYSFGSHDLDAYLDTIRRMNQEAGTPYAGAEDMLDAPVRYSVDREAVSHLDDVNAVSNSLMMPIYGIAAIAVFLLFAGLRMFGTKPVAGALLWAGVGAAAAVALAAVWAVVSFDGFFSTLHSLFFADGTWTFPADSLLITMLPEGFWAGIGAVWAVVSATLAALSAALGSVLGRRSGPEPQRS